MFRRKDDLGTFVWWYVYIYIYMLLSTIDMFATDKYVILCVYTYFYIYIHVGAFPEYVWVNISSYLILRKNGTSLF